MSFAKKASLLGISELLMTIGNIGSSVIFSRFLGPEGVGQYMVFMSLLSITAPLASLGIGRANIFFLNSGRYPRQQVVSNSLFVGLVASLLLLVGMTPVLQNRADYFGDLPLGVLIIFTSGVACQVIISLLRPVLVAALASRKILSVDVIQRGTVVLAALIVALAGVLDVSMALFIRAFAALAALALLLYFLRDELRSWPRFDAAWFRPTASYGIKIVVGGMLFTLTTSLTVLIIRFQLPNDFASVGFYTRAVSISGFVVLIPRALSPLFYAKWADRRNTDRVAQIERAARFNVGYGVAAAIGLLLFGKYAILLLYGREFLPANPALSIFAGAMVFNCLFSIFNSLLASDGRAATTARILAATLAIVCGLTFLLVPFWGIYGAAVAVLLGNVFSTVAMAVISRKLYGINLRNMMMIRGSDLQYLVRSLLGTR